MRTPRSPGRLAAVDRYVKAMDEEGHLPPPHEPAAACDPVVTISRQDGCNAHAIADAVVRLLRPASRTGSAPWTVFDRNLVERVLEDHRLPSRLAEFMPEDRVSAVTDSLDELFGIHPSTHLLVRRTAETIRRLAAVGNAVIIGRAANIVTADMPNALHVRLVGSIDRRIRRIAERRGSTTAAAEEEVRKTDIARRRYVEKYYHADIDDPLLHDLTINVDDFSIDEVAALVAAGVRSKTRGGGMTRSSRPRERLPGEFARADRTPAESRG
jgi:cytidylate kinase